MSHDWDIVDAPDPGPPPEPTGLDERRIRAVTAERRAANRARVRAQLMIPVAAALAIAAAFRAAATWTTSPRYSIACSVVSIVAGFVAARAIRTRWVAAAPLPDASSPPPNFAALGGDGDDAAARLARLDEETRA